ncbi:LysR family transcriptional regulator [Oricola sp.]|uniref:LysR family transcriptional regulator n=1 Tax=Oricola sp. TaxID=1979950 RepID=UPI0025E3F81E|nr:LysR family transcriptional regulator [Oricola sp.]MCI5076760.1 LysR family transcriptional regulator [Oricola sp.]
MLTAFDAVLRTGSASAAARDLQLSQGTVSRLIQNLEGQLGRELFLREKKRLLPTQSAIDFGRDVSTALDLIQRSSMRLSANLDGGSLALAILPAFGTRWLAPRLATFVADNPGITINLSTRIQPPDFSSDGFDAAIYFGPETRSPAHHLKLFDERLVACAAPSLLEQHPIASPADMRGLQFFQIETRPSAWRSWFDDQGTKALDVSGMLFDQFAPMIEATIAGLGVALLPEYIAESEIATGRLSPILTKTVTGTGAYWLAWPSDRAQHKPLIAFRSWLENEIAAEGEKAPATAFGQTP